MGGNMSYTLIMIVVLIAVFYFFMIRPENKRKKQQDEMRSNLRKGDKITTIGGVIGRIVKVEDDSIILETSEDRVRMEFAKWAISTVGDQNKTENKKSKKQITDESADAADAEEETAE